MTSNLLPDSTAIQNALSGLDDGAAVAVVPQTIHLPTLDAMRGIASLSVCWFHFADAQFTERFPVYQAAGRYGYLGVQIFFVISGFIIRRRFFGLTIELVHSSAF